MFEQSKPYPLLTLEAKKSANAPAAASLMNAPMDLLTPVMKMMTLMAISAAPEIIKSSRVCFIRAAARLPMAFLRRLRSVRRAG